MVIFRPHRGGLAESMEEAKEFETIDSMKHYIVELNTDPDFGPAFDEDDIVLDNEAMDDYRTGWHDTRYVCVKRYHQEHYDSPQCIGMWATDYK